MLSWPTLNWETVQRTVLSPKPHQPSWSRSPDQPLQPQHLSLIVGRTVIQMEDI